MHNHIPDAVRNKIRLAVGGPVVVSIGSFYVAQVADTGEVAGMAFMIGLSGVIIAAVWGPYLHWAWRTRNVEELHEDAVADILYTISRNRKDIEALLLALDAVSRQSVPGQGWAPTGTTRPPLSLVGRDEG